MNPTLDLARADAPTSATTAFTPGFTGLRYHAYDRRFRFSAPLVEAPGERFEVRTSTGEAMWLRPIGRVEIPLGRLPVFWVDVYGGGFFVPTRITRYSPR